MVTPGFLDAAPGVGRLARRMALPGGTAQPPAAEAGVGAGRRLRASLSHNGRLQEQCMGKRLTQIATRTGDDGTTGLGDNTRVSKDHLRVHAMGDVDELNSQIGLLLCEPVPADVRGELVEIQHQLFNLGGELSIPGYELLKAEAVAA